MHEKVANQRKNYLHHKSRELAANFDVVAIEDLHMKGMSRALPFGKSIADNRWRMVTTFLAYKLQEQGKQLVKIYKWFPSTKMCSRCGNKKEMSLSERTNECFCGLTISRDYNAAITKEAMRLFAIKKTPKGALLRLEPRSFSINLSVLSLCLACKHIL